MDQMRITTYYLGKPIIGPWLDYDEAQFVDVCLTFANRGSKFTVEFRTIDE